MSEEDKAPQPLTSWKEIAEHLHVAVRTAQAWEREKGLPVNRMPGKKGRVNADPAELDHWKQSVSHRSHWFFKPGRFKVYVFPLAIFLIAVAAYESVHFLRESRDHSPATTRVEQQPLVVVDHSKNEHLRKDIPETGQLNAGPHTTSELERMITFRDVDDDGELETILHYSPVGLHPGPTASNGVNGRKEKGQSLAAAPPPTSESSVLSKR